MVDKNKSTTFALSKITNNNQNSTIMNKKEFNKIVKATGKNVEVVKALNNEAYFLYVDGELIFSDTACEEIYNYETALSFYADYLLDKHVHEEKKIYNIDRWELKPIVKVSGIKKAVSELKGYKYGKAFLNLDNGKIEVIETTSYSDYEMPNGGNYLYMLRHSKYNNPATMERFRKTLEELAHDYEYKVIIEF